jgi:hypothetical protein
VPLRRWTAPGSPGADRIMIALALAALAAIAVALSQLRGAEAGLDIRAFRVGTTPATLFAPGGDAQPSPVVVIAHGFAGSETLMRGYATTLARSGLRAVTFDFLGHGRNPAPLAGDVTREEGATARLLDELGRVVASARALPGVDGRVALLGHSMAADILVRHAQARPETAAVVAVSMFSPVVTAGAPRNLLMVAGEWEGFLVAEALRALRLSAGEGAVEGATYGDPAAPGFGARRVAVADAVEHIGVLYDPEAMAEARDWLAAVFGVAAGAYADARGPWILLLILGLVALARPLSALLPRVAEAPAGAGLPWRRLWPVALAPAVATPLILAPFDLRLLPVIVGDYLALHFALYGALTALTLALVAPQALRRGGRPRAGALALGAAAVAAYAVGAVGWAVDAWVTAFWPIPARWGLLAAMLAGTLPFFLAVEWATRGPGHGRGAYAAVKLLFLLSLAAAVALNLERLFFLIILAPALALFFLVFGLFGDWAYRATGHPVVGALANAAVFATGIAAVFPMLAA